MKCETCGGPTRKRAVAPERPYYYAIGGLPQFPLTSGVTVYECPKCRAEAVTLEAPGETNRRIARTLLWKPAPLTGDELRFLRKHAGYSAQDFAELISVDPAYLSRFENGKHAQLGRGTERLARLILAVKEDGRIPNEAVILPTGTDGADSEKLEEWHRFVAALARPSPEWNRQVLSGLWEQKKHHDAMQASARTAREETRPFTVALRGGRKPLARPKRGT